MSAIRYEHGIHAIDTHYLRPGLDASHLIVHEGRAAFVDAGAAPGVPHLLAALDELSIPRDRVEWILLTHVHLDHAGGAGALLRELPQAKVALHPRGAPHLIDPARLIAASIAVYGAERYAALYGEIVPIPAERVVVTTPDQRLSLAGRELGVLHTPGHALHHQVFFDHQARAVFTGDTFGLSYREFDVDGRAFAFPTTTPTQFDPQQLIESIERILALQPQRAYFTHFGEVRDLERIGADLVRQIRSFERIARASDDRATIRAGITAVVAEELHRHGYAADVATLEAVLGFDLDLNTDGLLAWRARIA